MIVDQSKCFHLPPEASKYYPGDLAQNVGEASWNMAVDETLFEKVSVEISCPMIRFYRWNRNAITIGRSQNCLKTILTNFCQRDGIEIVRRITGGRGILHGDDLTVSIASPIGAFGLGSEAGISEVYRAVSSCFVDAFDQLGISTNQGSEPSFKNVDVRGDCFALATKADILDVSTGNKILGAALYKRGGRVLLQASIPLNHAPEEQRNLARRYFETDHQNDITLKVANPIDPIELETSMLEVFSSRLKVKIVSSDFSSPDRVRTRTLAIERYPPFGNLPIDRVGQL